MLANWISWSYTLVVEWLRLVSQHLGKSSFPLGPGHVDKNDDTEEVDVIQVKFCLGRPEMKEKKNMRKVSK